MESDEIHVEQYNGVSNQTPGFNYVTIHVQHNPRALIYLRNTTQLSCH